MMAGVRPGGRLSARAKTRAGCACRRETSPRLRRRALFSPLSVAVDRSHQAPKRQRRDLLLEEVLKQAGIPLLRSDDEQLLAERVRAHLCAQRPETAA